MYKQIVYRHGYAESLIVDTDVPVFNSFKRESAYGTMSMIPKGTKSVLEFDNVLNDTNSASNASPANEEEHDVESALFEFYAAVDIDISNTMSDSDDE